MRLVIAAAIIACMAPAGCQTPCRDTPPASTSLSYHCDDGSDLTVTYLHQPDSVHVVQEGYAPIDLPSRITGSGFRYAQEGSELRGRGQDVRWERPGAAATLCHEADAGRS